MDAKVFWAPIIAVLIWILAAFAALGQEQYENHDWIMNNPSYVQRQRIPNEADWIEDNKDFKRHHRWNSSGNIHCCDPSHCRPLTDEEIAELVQEPDGWTMRGVRFRYGEKGLYFTESGETVTDQKWFGCFTGELPVCLFEPQFGS